MNALFNAILIITAPFMIPYVALGLYFTKSEENVPTLREAFKVACQEFWLALDTRIL